MKLVGAFPPVVGLRLEEVVRLLRSVNAVVVTESRHNNDGSRCLWQAADRCHHVDDRLSGQAGNRCGADVLYRSDQPWRQSSFEADPLLLEQHSPMRVIRTEGDRRAFHENVPLSSWTTEPVTS